METTQTNPAQTRVSLSSFSYRDLDDLFVDLGRKAERAIRDGSPKDAEHLLRERRKVQLEVEVRMAQKATLAALQGASDLAVELAAHALAEAEAELGELCEGGE